MLGFIILVQWKFRAEVNFLPIPNRDIKLLIHGSKMVRNYLHKIAFNMLQCNMSSIQIALIFRFLNPQFLLNSHYVSRD